MSESIGRESRLKARLSLLGRVVLVIALVVSALALGNTIYIRITKKSTSVNTLDVSHQEVPSKLPVQTADSDSLGGRTNETTQRDTIGWVLTKEKKDMELMWEIPVGAPINDFPMAAQPENMYCTSAQVNWLEAHAIGYTWGGSRITVMVQNTATSGEALSLGNIHFEGKEVDPEPTVLFSCPLPPSGDPGSRSLILDVDGTAAICDDLSESYGPCDGAPGLPVTLNLQPGELNGISFKRDAAVDIHRQYEGRIVADVLSDIGKEVVLAEDVVFLKEPVDGFFIGYPSGDFEEGFSCRTGIGTPSFRDKKISLRDDPDTAPCTLDQAAQLLKDAATIAGWAGRHDDVDQ